VRARRGAPVATPLHPEELADDDTRPDRWTLRDLPGRLERDGDPWARGGGALQTITAARRRLQKAMDEL
jgi:bifunctional non-homologous end joining protein LigD